MISETSIESLKELATTRDLGICEAQVYLYIKHHPGCSLKDIHEGTGLLQENVCGRKKALEEKGLIIKAGEKHNSDTNRIVETWKISNGEVQKQEPPMLREKELYKTRDYIKKANDYQKGLIRGWCDTKWD